MHTIYDRFIFLFDILFFFDFLEKYRANTVFVIELDLVRSFLCTMSTRITRSSTRNSVIGISTPSTPNSLKSAVSEQRRRQRKKDIEVHLKVSNVNDDESDGDEEHVTPPKQRKSCAKVNGLSPSTLLHRLSLGEQDENQPDTTNVPEKPKSKIDNVRKVLNAAETEDLYGREKETAELNEFLMSNAAKKTSASIYISGQPGK